MQTISFQIDSAWFYTYNKISDLQLNFPFKFEELNSVKEFPIQYLLRCNEEMSSQIIDGLKKISTISNVYICSERKAY